MENDGGATEGSAALGMEPKNAPSTNAAEARPGWVRPHPWRQLWKGKGEEGGNTRVGGREGLRNGEH